MTLPAKPKRNISLPKNILIGCGIGGAAAIIILVITIVADEHSFSIHGKGSEKLTLKHPNDIVLRKSAFTCSRTIAINCDKASDDIPRAMVKKLQNPKTSGKLVIEIK